MAPSPGSKLSPAELAALEHAFAADPASDAYRPLAEAYLGMGRYMEAMVVGKKGVRAHPASAVPRVLLARVHAAQGKEKKALEELAAALVAEPNDAAALRLAIEIHLRAGEKDAAAARIREAALAHPEDEGFRTMAREAGVEVAPPAPEPVPEPAPEPPPATEAIVPAEVPGPLAVAEAPGPIVSVPSPPPVAPAAGTPAAPPARAAEPPPAPPVLSPEPKAAPPTVAPAPPQAAAPARAPRPAAPRPTAPPIDLSRLLDEDEEREARRRSAQGKKSLVALLVSAAVGLAAIGGWWGYTRWQAGVERQISKLLEETNEYIDRDTYASYKKASESADRILELDPDNYVAHAYLAYIAALRWGEQGEGEDFQRRARLHLEEALDEGETHSRIVAADAYIKFFQGEYKAAEKAIDAVLSTGQRSALLYSTLGILQMYAGDLDRAAASLKQAQGLEPNNVRILAALGQLHRRRGMDAEAWTYYDSALRLDKEHADSLLGKALLVLDANETSRPKDEREALLAEAEQQIAKVLGLPAGAISARQLALAKFARAQLLYAREKNGEAERLEGEAFTLDPSNPDIRLMRGRRLLRAGDPDRAVAEIRQAIQLDDKRASFYVDLSRALLARPGGAKEAVAALEKARAAFPQSGKILVLLGDAQQAAADAKGARASFEKAIEVEGGKMPEARAKLGQLQRQAKDWETAKATLEAAVKEYGLGGSGPGLALALTELGRIAEEGPKPDLKEAFERYVRATEVGPAYAPPYFFLGRISAGQRGQARQAVELLQTYLDLAAKDGEHVAEARELLAGLR